MINYLIYFNIISIILRSYIFIKRKTILALSQQDMKGQIRGCVVSMVSVEEKFAHSHCSPGIQVKKRTWTLKNQLTGSYQSRLDACDSQLRIESLRKLILGTNGIHFFMFWSQSIIYSTCGLFQRAESEERINCEYNLVYILCIHTCNE